MGLWRSCKNVVKIIANITFIFIQCHCKPGILLHIYSYNIKLMFGKERLVCLKRDLIFAAPPCEKVNYVSDQNCITSGIRKFMLDICQVLVASKI